MKESFENNILENKDIINNQITNLQEAIKEKYKNRIKLELHNTSKMYYELLKDTDYQNEICESIEKYIQADENLKDIFHKRKSDIVKHNLNETQESALVVNLLSFSNIIAHKIIEFGGHSEILFGKRDEHSFVREIKKLIEKKSLDKRYKYNEKIVEYELNKDKKGYINRKTIDKEVIGLIDLYQKSSFKDNDKLSIEENLILFNKCIQKVEMSNLFFSLKENLIELFTRYYNEIDFAIKKEQQSKVNGEQGGRMFYCSKNNYYYNSCHISRKSIIYELSKRYPNRISTTNNLSRSISPSIPINLTDEEASMCKNVPRNAFPFGRFKELDSQINIEVGDNNDRKK